MDFYERVKILLKQKDKSIKEMCKSLNIPHATYRTNRDRKLAQRLDIVKKIAEYLGVSIDFLATGKESQSNLSEEQSDLLLLVAQLKPESVADAKKSLKHILRDQEENQ